MNKILALLLCALPFAVIAQPLTFSKVLSFDSSLTKSTIYDRALIWCGTAFGNSNYAIKVHEKESGIISGQALLKSYYKTPGRKDSANGEVYIDYEFDWLIETKDGKLRFSISNVQYEYMGLKHPVNDVDEKPPVSIMFQSKEKTRIEWACSKHYFIANIDKLTISIYNNIVSAKPDF